MRSRADQRVAREWLLRTALVAALALALWRSLAPPAATTSAVRTDARGLATALIDATRSDRVRELDVALDSTADRTARAWLRALRRAGVAVRWSGAPPALAAQAERSAEPESRVRLAIAGDSGVVALADSAGPLDSLRLGARGASLESPNVVGHVRAARGSWIAEVAVPPALAPRAVLVLGRAGWESRFVAAALGEAGWTVRSRQPVAPDVVVTDADVLPLDTTRYAVVVALDSTAAPLAPAIARFVAQGGGLVLAGDAPALPALARLAPARTGERRPGRPLLSADTITAADLPLRALTALGGDAVRLDGVRAVRRAGLGRVLTLGYDETWRWRMLGGASGLAAHRSWWSRTVGLVAPAAQGGAVTATDAAPLAALVEELGPPARTEAAKAATAPRDPLPLALLLLVVVLLLAETASRRFRGAR